MANPGPAIYRIQKKMSPLSLSNVLNPHHKEKSGTEKKIVRRRLGSINFASRIAVRRKGADYVSRLAKIRKVKESTMDETAKTIRALELIVNNAGEDVNKVIQLCEDKEVLAGVARSLMMTCLQGWKLVDNAYVHDNGLKFDANSFVLNEDTSLSPRIGISFDYDWLYDLATAAETLTEAVRSGIDPDKLTRVLSNTIDVLASLDDNKIKEYILEREKAAGKADIKLLQQVFKDKNIGINWRLEKWGPGESTDEHPTVNLIIRVKYSTDGTINGLVEKILNVTIEPGQRVTELPVKKEKAKQETTTPPELEI